MAALAKLPDLNLNLQMKYQIIFELRDDAYSYCLNMVLPFPLGPKYLKKLTAKGYFEAELWCSML